jgi:hypothetical protein
MGCVLLLTLSSLTYAQEESPTLESASRLPSRALKSFLRCARKTIQTRRGGLASVKKIGGWFEDLRLSASISSDDLEKTAKTLSKACWSLKKDSDKLPEQSRNIGEYLGEEETFEHSSQTLQLLRAFYSPLKNCVRKGVDLEATVLVGGTVGVVAGRCVSSDGREYYLIQPRVGLSVGFSVSGGWTRDESNALVQFNVSTFKNKGTLTTTRETIVEDPNDGFGGAYSAGVRVRYELPLNFRSDWKSVSDRLLR